jgi:hypothetical protein
MHMVQLQMPFDDLAFLLPGQGMKNRPELGTDLPVQHLPPPLGPHHIMPTFLRPFPFTIVGILFLVSLSVLLSG